tara:strand:+ start:2589 stop:4271 length:1683 start_codon:yes stop_codon:yes gene_type:complete
MTSSSKNKQINLFATAGDPHPFSISIASDNQVLMTTHNVQNANDTSLFDIKMRCTDLIIEDSTNSQQSVKATLDSLVKTGGTVPTNYIINDVDYMKLKRGSANYTCLNDAFLWENNRAVDSENCIKEFREQNQGKTNNILNIPISTPTKGEYINLNQAFVDENTRAITRENTIVSTSEILSSANIPLDTKIRGTFSNINNAFVAENCRAIERENSIISPRTWNTIQTLPADIKCNSNFININEAFCSENSRAIDRENSIIEMKTKGDTYLWTNSPSTPSDGIYHNINQAFVQENTRAINRENEIVQEYIDNTSLGVASTYKDILIGADSIEYASNYKMKDVMNYTNINQAVLDEHRRSVTVENEINNRISTLLSGTTEQGLNSLSEIVGMFQNNDLTLSSNLQNFSTRYNALINDFNTLSTSHNHLLERFNETFDTTDSSQPVYTDVTHQSISFNITTGLVNITREINDMDNSWDKSGEPSTGGVWCVQTSQNNKLLVLPMGVNIQAGASLIIRRCDLTLQDPKIFTVKYGDSQTVVMNNNNDELVLLGITGEWIALKVP